jgi:predicted O-methyltransferase YrrM
VNFFEDYTQRCDNGSDIHEHLPFLYQSVCRFPGATVLELGTRSGNSTAAFLAAVEAVEGHLWSIDIDTPHIPDWWREGDWWSFHQGNDTLDAAQQFAPPVVDVLFIDTSHYYEHTLEELRLYVPRVRKGGVVLMHDTELENPEGGGPAQNFPVARALDDFCAESGREWVNRPGCYGLGVMEIH